MSLHSAFGFLFLFYNKISIFSNGCIQIQGWKSPIQKLRDERVFVHTTNSLSYSQNTMAYIALI